MSDKLVVVIVGASGNTGDSIVQGLLKNSDRFKVVALTRPSSISKPQVTKLSSEGVEIRAADISTDSVEKLSEVLTGVDVLISTVNVDVLFDQKRLFDAARLAGVKRVVPSEFATPGKRGVRELLDKKLDVREYIQSIGLHYTFIDVGWWMQGSLPSSSKVTSYLGPFADEVYGDNPSLVTDLDHIGDYVARIIADERTLDQYVIVWEDEVTQRQTREIAGRVTGESEEIQTRTKYISKEELEQRIVMAKAEFARTGDIKMFYWFSGSQYFLSMYILGENSLQFAKSLGALDVRELYPDILPTTLEEFAREFYSGKSRNDSYALE